MKELGTGLNYLFWRYTRRLTGRLKGRLRGMKRSILRVQHVATVYYVDGKKHVPGNRILTES